MEHFGDAGGSDGKAHQKTVKLGIRNGDDVQIVDGVTPATKSWPHGAYGLPDNTKIKVEAAEAPGRTTDAPRRDAKAPSEGSNEK